MKKNEKEYSVGYGKPPRHSQFSPGRSGNPKGRPKKVATLPDILSKELRARVPIISNGKSRKVTMLEAIVKQHLNKAANGDSKAASLIFTQLKDSNAGTGDNLNDLVQEFRALHARQVAADADPGRLTDGEVGGECL